MADHSSENNCFLLNRIPSDLLFHLWKQVKKDFEGTLPYTLPWRFPKLAPKPASLTLKAISFTFAVAIGNRLSIWPCFPYFFWNLLPSILHSPTLYKTLECFRGGEFSEVAAWDLSPQPLQLVDA